MKMRLKQVEVELAAYREHIPVLLNSAAELLVTDSSGIYLDATLGGGGHAIEILNRLDPHAMLFGLDQDTEALEAAKRRIGKDTRFHTIQGNFGYISTLLPPEICGNVCGILFDLGVSTHQIREA